MEDDLKKMKWKNTSKKMKMEDDLNFDGRQPHLYLNGRRPKKMQF